MSALRKNNFALFLASGFFLMERPERDLIPGDLEFAVTQPFTDTECQNELPCDVDISTFSSFIEAHQTLSQDYDGAIQFQPSSEYACIGRDYFRVYEIRGSEAYPC